MNWPNVLTVSRIGFAFILVYLLLQNCLTANIWAVIFFTAASLTDFYDGYLAKRQGLMSDFGKIMDPIADKVLMLSMFFVLTYIGMIALWMVVFIAAREILVTADRLRCVRQGQILAAERAGKIKTIFQMITVSVILLYLILEQAAFGYSWFYQVQKAYLGAINIFMVLTVFLTVGSGAAYFQHRLRSLSS
ncbi:MAG: CDP-diacylglycerol--glycerol-3-phosphate 3-phosphatidyltransferase [Candidatus Omnitrophica bacterium]|nr:CDP-diacylglycerol--glycerol-3-phosphate 3-phosphatidyltransferase [Candidatus Omnitrophota bacterium]